MSATTEIFTGGAILTFASGAFAATWRYGKGALTWSTRRLIQRSTYCGDAAKHAIGELIDRHGLPRIRDRVYNLEGETIRGHVAATADLLCVTSDVGVVVQLGNDHSYARVSYEDLRGQTFVFWDGWRPIYATDATPRATSAAPTQPGMLAAAQNNDDYEHIQNLSRPSRRLQVFALRGHIDHDEMAKSVAKRSLVTDNGPRAKVRFRACRFPPASSAVNHGIGNDRSGSGDSTWSWFRRPDVRVVGHDPDYMGWIPRQGGGEIDGMALGDDAREVAAEVRRWLATKDWHEERGLGWHMGIGLHGDPGTGKTTMARALAVDNDLPIFTFALNEMTNSEFLEHWVSLRSVTPCIVLFEDFDRVFKGREPVRPPSLGFGLPGDEKATRGPERVQFDALINAIDGVDRSVSDGILTIVTTNVLEDLDPALGGPTHPGGRACPRPGRIDIVLELKGIDRGGRLKLARRIAAGLPGVLAELEAEDPAPETPAQYEFRVARLARKAYMATLDAPASSRPAEDFT